MSTQNRSDRPLRKDAVRNRQRILGAARELFAERGLKPNLNDVAHHAGLGVGTVYRRFTTKEELLEEIFVDALDRMTALAGEGLSHQDPWEGFVGFVENMCELTATDRGLREIAFSKAFVGPRVTAAQERLTPVLVQLIERAHRDGRLRSGVSFTDMPLLCLLAGRVSEYAGHVDPALWRRYAGMLIDGMRSREDQGLLVDALDEPGLDDAMRTWAPAGVSSAAGPPRRR